MALEIIGTVHKVLESIGGTSRNGNEWKKGQFVLEYGDNFPKQVYCTAWGDMITQVEALKPGEKIKAFIDLQSREYNERWYTDAKVWRIEKVDAAAGGTDASAPSSSGTEAPSSEGLPPIDELPADEDDLEDDQEDDLPF